MTAAIAQNMTGGNMTTQGTNMTDANQTGSISSLQAGSSEEESEQELDLDLGGGGGDSKLDFGNNQGGKY